MLLKDVSIWNNLFATLFTWTLLAGFLVLPGSFQTLDQLPINFTAFKDMLAAVKHLPLLALGLSCCVIGAMGMCFLWWHQRANYVWLVGNIFIPGWLSGTAGLISTFVGIYGHNNGAYSTLSIATLVVTGASTVICGFLAAFYSFWLLRRLKHEHVRKQRETGSETGSAVFGTGKWSR